MGLTKVINDYWHQYGITVVDKGEMTTNPGIPQSCQYEHKFKIKTPIKEVNNIMLFVVAHSCSIHSIYFHASFDFQDMPLHGNIELPNGAEQLTLQAFKRAMDQLSSQNACLRHVVSEDVCYSPLQHQITAF
jgi:hypothetical protein